MQGKRYPVVAVTRHALAGLAAAAVLLAGCAAPRTQSEGDLASGAPAIAADTQRLSPEVTVARVAPGLWMHTTWQDLPGVGPYPANGMLLETEDGSVLVDTGWNDAHAEALLAWAARDLRRPVRRAVVTHSHEDRLGGIAALRKAGVPVSALGLTGELARGHGLPAPDSVPGLDRAPVRDPAGFELLYPGAGHTRDNVVVYFPRQGVLFGGCLVKADTATTVGNVADADVPHWPRAVAGVREAYPQLRTVVPGHGAVGGAGALRHTETLIETRGPAAVERFRRSRGV